MRALFATFFLSMALFAGVIAYSQLVANSRYLARASESLRDWASVLPEPTLDEQLQVINLAKERASLYDKEIGRNHLVDGMLVNRTLSGRMFDQCDSLLFSSLRFTALHKLGFDDKAEEAWTKLQASRSDGNWLRHPRCDKSTSRDMIIGLLIALSQEPRGYQQHLKALIDHVRRNDGYFGTGPVYVSYLTPTVAKLLAEMAPLSDISASDLPAIVRDGYSTNELEVAITDSGYQAHLIALSIWLEMEVADATARQANPRMKPRTPGALLVDQLVAPLAGVNPHDQRLEWTAQELVRVDPKNLFFRYLRLRSAGAFNPSVAYRLMNELMAMRQFPDDRLPLDCDRRADYLWQRSSHQFEPATHGCSRQYHGTDFLWMAALLAEGMRTPPLLELSH